MPLNSPYEDETEDEFRARLGNPFADALAAVGVPAQADEPISLKPPSETDAPPGPRGFEVAAVGGAQLNTPKASSGAMSWLGDLLKKHEGQRGEESLALQALRAKQGEAQETNRLRGMGAGLTSAVLSFARDPAAAAWLQRSHALSTPKDTSGDDFGAWLSGRKDARASEIAAAKGGEAMALEREKFGFQKDKLGAESAKAAALKAEKDARQKFEDERRVKERGEDATNAMARAKVSARAAADARGDRKDERLDAETEKQVGEYGKAIGDWLPKMASSLAAINPIVEKYRHGGDMPGVGFWDARKPGVANSPEDRVMRLNQEALRNMILRQETGAAIAANEEERKKIEMGLSATASQDDFVAAMDILNRNVHSGVKAAAARFKPEAIKTYGDRKGMTPEGFFKAVGAKNEAQPQGAVSFEWQGATYDIPASEVADFLKEHKGAVAK